MGATAPEIPQSSNPSMEPELAIVVVETGKVKKEITKATLARTQQTSAKKKPAKKKAAKKPAKKKAKKPKKKAKKKKKKKKKATKALWAYIKKNKLSKGRTITPDAKLKKVLPAGSLSMFKMPGMLKKHIK